MKSIALKTLADFAGGELRQGDGAQWVTQVSTDTRKLTPGVVFVALRGERFDAHDFVPDAVRSGVAAVVVERGRVNMGNAENVAIIEVADSLAALQQMAAGYRAWHQPLIVGLAGSNGKTSTKDMTAAVLARRYAVRATVGNLNNHIGVPLTLLALEEQDECGVVEMGMNHPGEIKTLVDIAQPDAAILTNIGIAHIEYMGSQDAIAWEKASLPANVPADGVVVLNADDPYTPRIARHCQASVLTAGIRAGEVRALDLRPEPQGTRFKLDFSGEVEEVFLPIVGEHMVGNAALAACMGWAQGLPPSEIAAALQEARLTGGRMETKTMNGIRFIDDSYNANPDSMKAGLLTLSGLQISGRKIAVLGRMGELGPHAAAEHRRIGELAASLGLDAVYSIGTEAEQITAAAKAGEVRHFDDHAACAAYLKTQLREGDAVLLKGSRSAGMEKVLIYFQTA